MSGTFQNLKGTLQNAFKLGKNKFNFDAAAATALRQFILPNSDINFTGGTNGDVLTKTAGGFVLQAATAGAPTKFGAWSSTENYVLNDFVTYNGFVYMSLTSNLNSQPDINPSDWEKKYGVDYGTYYSSATSLSGTINGPVHVNGNLTLTGALTVNGNLYVNGSISNNGIAGRDLIVKGDLISLLIVGLYGAASTNGSNLIVGGDAIVEAIYTDGGDGALTTPGSISIGGDLICWGQGLPTDSISATSGDFTSVTAAIASSVTINGDMFLIKNCNLSGGSNPSTSVAGVGMPGQNLTVKGNVVILNGSIITKGGAGTSGTNGKAGNITISGNCAISYIDNSCDIDARGGNLVGSVATTGTAGAGGTILIYGNTLIAGTIYSSGGNGQGSAAHHSGGAAGTITIGGNVSCSYLYSLGGTGSNDGNGGTGGTIAISGNCNVTNDIKSCSGAAFDSVGASGAITIYGNLSCINLDTRSGNSTNDNVGAAGTVLIYGNASATNIYTNGGSGGTGMDGGDSGNITVNQDLYCTGSIITTGSIWVGSGNNGGQIQVRGCLLGNPNIETSGNTAIQGASLSPGSNAGSIQIDGDAYLNSFRANGGDVVSSSTGTGGTGATIQIGGSLFINSNSPLYSNTANGGASLSPTTGVGGIGGTITAKAIIINDSTTSISVNGGIGGATGGNGGNGGTITITCLSKLNDVFLNGGNANAGTSANGNAGQFNAIGGFTANSITALDGIGIGTVPASTGKGVWLNGIVNCKTITVSDRTASTGIGVGLYSVSFLAVLKVNALVNRTQLSKGITGSALTAVLVSPSTKLYSNDGTVGWYEHTGGVI